jgi:hypothetical protein
VFIAHPANIEAAAAEISSGRSILAPNDLMAALINVITIIVLVRTSIGVFNVGKTSFVKGIAAGRPSQDHLALCFVCDFERFCPFISSLMPRAIDGAFVTAELASKGGGHGNNNPSSDKCTDGEFSIFHC